MIGTSAGHYEILETLGEGGEKRSRFITQAPSASALNPPNIVTIHEVASPSGDGKRLACFGSSHKASLAGGRLFYASSDVQSNVWLAERRPVRSASN